LTVNDVYLFTEQLAPFKYQDRYDNSGFLIGEPDAKITRICLCLDITLDIIAEAVEKGANLIISHHPVIFKPISGIKAETPVHELIKRGINVISAHTNTDAVFMADAMLDVLGFPCSNEFVEVVAENVGYGKIVNLPAPLSPAELALKCKNAFNSPFVKYVDGKKPVSRAAVFPGSASSIFDYASVRDCDAFITGEVKHSLFVEAENRGVTLIEAGHYHTEIVFCEFLKNKLYENFKNIEQNSIFIAENSKDFCKYI